MQSQQNTNCDLSISRGLGSSVGVQLFGKLGHCFFNLEKKIKKAHGFDKISVVTKNVNRNQNCEQNTLQITTL